MKYFFFLLIVITSLLCVNNSNAQFRKMDTTMKMGKVGYKVFCTNKLADKNDLSIKPVGFDKDARDMQFPIRGRVKGAEIDDLNNDGFPDMVIYIYSGANGEMGTVYGFVSDQNKSYMPFALPDVVLDGKLKEGYKGYDVFTLLEGKLMQEFPIYKDGDAKDKPSGGKRVVIYNVIGSDAGGYKFKVQRTYDIK